MRERSDNDKIELRGDRTLSQDPDDYSMYRGHSSGIILTTSRGNEWELTLWCSNRLVRREIVKGVIPLRPASL